MHTDTRENDGPCICDDCERDSETCGCAVEDCLDAARENYYEGMRDAYD